MIIMIDNIIRDLRPTGTRPRDASVWNRDETLVRLETETSRPRPHPWYFMSASVLLRAAYCNSYFDSHRHSQGNGLFIPGHSIQFGHIFLHNIPWAIMHEISQLRIPKWWPIWKSNPETGSRDYEFLNPESLEWKFNTGISITNDTILLPTPINSILNVYLFCLSAIVVVYVFCLQLLCMSISELW